MSEDTEFEELEQIPWSVLAAKTPNMTVRLGAVAVLGVVVLVLAAFLLLKGSGPDPAAESVLPVVSETTVTSVEPPSSTAPAVPAPYSEADLMAISIDDESRLAEMHAEWFVRDYLTADGDETSAARVGSLIPVEIPDPEPGFSSYVEWVDTLAVTASEPGTYVVDVAYRLLVGHDGVFERQPVGALAVKLAVGADGAVRLAALPEVIDSPETGPLLTVAADTAESFEPVAGMMLPVAAAGG
jgi:hypothetical protein